MEGIGGYDLTKQLNEDRNIHLHAPICWRPFPAESLSKVVHSRDLTSVLALRQRRPDTRWRNICRILRYFSKASAGKRQYNPIVCRFQMHIAIKNFSIQILLWIEWQFYCPLWRFYLNGRSPRVWTQVLLVVSQQVGTCRSIHASSIRSITSKTIQTSHI